MRGRSHLTADITYAILRISAVTDGIAIARKYALAITGPRAFRQPIRRLYFEPPR